MGELYYPYGTTHLEIEISLDMVYFKIIYGVIKKKFIVILRVFSSFVSMLWLRI